MSHFVVHLRLYVPTFKICCDNDVLICKTLELKEGVLFFTVTISVKCIKTEIKNGDEYWKQKQV